MKIKVAETEGEILDWLVARCQGVVWLDPDGELLGTARGMNYSTDPTHSYPIIFHKKIKTDPRKEHWEATIWNEAAIQNPAYGPTPLVAAMRCYVMSELGDEPEVPDEVMMDLVADHEKTAMASTADSPK